MGSKKNHGRITRLYNPNRFNCLDSGVCYLLLLAVFTALPYLFRFLIGDMLKGLLAYDYFAYSIVNALISQSSIFIVAFIYSLIRRVNPFSGGGYKARWDGIHVLMAIILTVGIMMLFYFTHLQFYGFSSEFADSGTQIKQNFSNLYLFYMIIYFAETAVLPAIIEEMAFRGVIMRGLEQFGGLFAVITSSAMFSLMHGNFAQLILQFIGGFAIGGVVYVTRNYLLGCIMHFVNNSFALVYTFLITPIFNGPINRNIVAVTGSASIVLGVVFCLVAGVYFISMLVEKEKNKALGKNPINKFEKKRYCQMKLGESEGLICCEQMQSLSDTYDERLYVIRGKYRRMNKKSASAVSFAVLGASVAFALVKLFFGI